MTLFARFLDALARSRQRKTDEVMRRYWYLVEQAHAHEEKKKIEEAKKLAAAAPSQPSFMTGAPSCNT